MHRNGFYGVVFTLAGTLSGTGTGNKWVLWFCGSFPIDPPQRQGLNVPYCFDPDSGLDRSLGSVCIMVYSLCMGMGPGPTLPGRIISHCSGPVPCAVSSPGPVQCE